MLILHGIESDVPRFYQHVLYNLLILHGIESCHFLHLTTSAFLRWLILHGIESVTLNVTVVLVVPELILHGIERLLLCNLVLSLRLQVNPPWN